jgi:hypothetical protein
MDKVFLTAEKGDFAMQFSAYLSTREDVRTDDFSWCKVQ